MPTYPKRGLSTFDRILRRYETTDTKCAACGYVDTEGNWTCQTNGREVVYHHTCPRCGADRDHVFTLDT